MAHLATWKGIGGIMKCRPLTFVITGMILSIALSAFSDERGDIAAAYALGSGSGSALLLSGGIRVYRGVWITAVLTDPGMVTTTHCDVGCADHHGGQLGVGVRLRRQRNRVSQFAQLLYGRFDTSEVYVPGDGVLDYRDYGIGSTSVFVPGVGADVSLGSRLSARVGIDLLLGQDVRPYKDFTVATANSAVRVYAGLRLTVGPKAGRHN